MLHGRYHVVDKLEYGGCSTVWLARETEKGRYVALKVNMADAGTGERKALKALAGSGSDYHPGRDHILDILDEFELAGPNGTHACLAMAPASCSLRDASFTQLFPLDVVLVPWHMELRLAWRICILGVCAWWYVFCSSRS